MARRLSAAASKAAILAWNASSICRASAAVKLFLAPRIRCAQVAASSDEAITLSSAKSWSRSAADALAPRIGLAGFAVDSCAATARSLVAECLDRRSTGLGCSPPVFRLPIRRASVRSDRARRDHLPRQSRPM